MTYSVLLSVTGHTGSKGGLEKPVLQPKFCVKTDKTHNSSHKKEVQCLLLESGFFKNDFFCYEKNFA